MTEIERLRADNAKLRAFAMEILNFPSDDPDWCACTLFYDIGGPHDVAVENELLYELRFDEPCGEKCRCEGYFTKGKKRQFLKNKERKFVRPTALLLGTIPTNIPQTNQGEPNDEHNC